MYFRGVNRGVTFTKAGFYLTGFVVLLGLFATSSGYNGFFLALGFGLSLLIISGLLSEKVMKSYECLGFSEAIVDPNVPFSVTFRMRNISADWVVLGADALVTIEPPRFRLLPRETPALLRSAPIALAPGETALVNGTGAGLPRGAYRNFHLVERTLYPFGLLFKFKVRPYETRILALPSFDESFAEKLAAEIRARLQAKTLPENFHSHRPLTSTDSHRRVDWRKSAGQASEQWSVKVYEAATPEHGVLVVGDGAELATAADESTYERQLSWLRTACDVAGTGEKRLALRVGGVVAGGREACVSLLASAPAFVERARGLGAAEAPATPGWYTKLVVSGAGYHWDPIPERLP